MKYRFVQDNDCHWCLIEADQYGLFIQLEENGETDGYAAFNNKFESCRVDHPTLFTIENPNDR